MGHSRIWRNCRIRTHGSSEVPRGSNHDGETTTAVQENALIELKDPPPELKALMNARKIIVDPNP